MRSHDSTCGRRTGPFVGSSLALVLSLAAGLAACAAMAPSAAFAQNRAHEAAQSAPRAAGAQNSAARSARAKKARTAKPAARQKAAPRSAAKPAPKGFIETIMAGPRLTTTPPEAADWVRATRPDTQPPRQAAARPPAQGRTLLTAEQIRAREAELERIRARHDRLAGRRSPSGPFGSAAGKPPAPEVAKHKPGCVLTCSTPIGVPRTQRR